MPTIFTIQQPAGGPVPATGQHAEQLHEILQAVQAMKILVESELNGIAHDGRGNWLVFDPVLDTAKRLVKLAEQRR